MWCPTSSLHVGSGFRAPIPQRLNADSFPAPVSQSLKTDYHLFATLENLLLGFGLCPAQISQRLRTQNSDPILDSPGCMTHPSGEIVSRSSFLIPSLLGLISPPQALLLSFLPELSSTFDFLIERKWLQEEVEKFMMLNKRRRWFHSSREKLPLVNMSANWFLVSINLIWTLGLQN